MEQDLRSIRGLAPFFNIGRKHHDMRIWGRIVGVRGTEQSVGIIVGAFDPDIMYNRESRFESKGSWKVNGQRKNQTLTG